MGQPLIEIRDLSKTFQTKDTEIHALNAINLTTRMIKTTSLVTLIGVIEVLKVGQQIIETSRFAYLI